MDRSLSSVNLFDQASSLPPFPEKVESGVFSRGGHDSSYALFAPVRYESGYAYPLFVWLHGPGDEERQLLRMMSLMSLRNYVAVAPRGPTAVQDGSGYTWRQTEGDIAAAEQRITDSIAIARAKYNVAPHRIFLAGFDCGGTMAYRVGLQYPDRFAGVISLGGPLPAGGPLFGRLNEIRRLSVLLAVGRDSRRYPAEEVCHHLRLFHTAGLCITLRQYPGGQELSPQMLADVDRWIIERITAPRQSEIGS
ncbi:MAG: alpha/beta hydrolase [Pirellulales bacterium]